MELYGRLPHSMPTNSVRRTPNLCSIPPLPVHGAGFEAFNGTASETGHSVQRRHRTQDRLASNYVSLSRPRLSLAAAEGAALDATALDGSSTDLDGS